MTYRDRAVPTSRALAIFTDFLKTAKQPIRRANFSLGFHSAMVDVPFVIFLSAAKSKTLRHILPL